MAVEDSVPHSGDLYQRLGLSRTASADEIKRHYRKLAMKWHPDKNPDDRETAADKFRLISQAYECLSDNKKRQDYDRFGVVPGENQSSPTSGTRHTGRSAYMGARSFDPFGPMDPMGMFFTFERAQRIFESFFGTRDPFSLFDDDQIHHSFGGSQMLPSLFESQSTLLGGFLSNDFFGEGRGRHNGFQSSSFLSSGSLGGGETVTKQITVVNGRKTTRTEKTTIGSDGVARRTVTEEVEDLPTASRPHSDRQPARILGTRSSREANSKGQSRPSAPMKLISPLPQSSSATKLSPAAAPVGQQPPRARRVPHVSSSTRATPLLASKSSEFRPGSPAVDIRKRHIASQSVERQTPSASLSHTPAAASTKYDRQLSASRIMGSSKPILSGTLEPSPYSPSPPLLRQMSSRVPIVSTLAETQPPSAHPTLDIPRPTSQARLYTTPDTDRVYSRHRSIGRIQASPQSARVPPSISHSSGTRAMAPSPLATYQKLQTRPPAMHHTTTKAHSSYPSFDWSSAPRPVKYAYIPPNKNVSYKATATAQ